jgi:hypothetical protein
MSDGQLVWGEPLPWSKDIQAWADQPVESFLHLHEGNFFQDHSDTELLAWRLYELSGAFSASFDYRVYNYDGITLGEYAYIIARCPDGFSGSAYKGIYGSLSESFEKRPLEATRELCEPYSALAWRIAEYRSGFVGRISDINDVEELLTVSKEYDGETLSFDRHARFIADMSSGPAVSFHVMKNDIDSNVFDALVNSEAY